MTNSFVYDPTEEALIRLRLSRERLDEAMADLRRELTRIEAFVREVAAILGEAKKS